MGRERNRRKPRVAFVLSGGGNLGAMQVGMLRALAERDIVADLVVGCSVGALNGAAYAADPTPAGVRRLEAHWMSVQSHTVMPSSRIPSPLLLLRRGEALHSAEGLAGEYREFLEQIESFEELRVPFQCVATDMEAAMSRWFDAGPLLPALLASAALPAVYPPVTIDGRRFIDGGVVDNVPIARAVELGARRIYVLHVGLHGRPDAEVRRPIDAALLAYWIARNNRFARDLAALPPGVEAVVLPPGDRPDIRYDDFSQTPPLMELGHERAAAFLDARAEAEAAGSRERRGPGALLEPMQRLMLGARGRVEAELAARRGGTVRGDDLDLTDGAEGDVDGAAGDALTEMRETVPGGSLHGAAAVESGPEGDGTRGQISP